VDVTYVFFGKLVSARDMGLVSVLLYCNASNLVLEILKRDKIWGIICILH